VQQRADAIFCGGLAISGWVIPRKAIDLFIETIQPIACPHPEGALAIQIEYVYGCRADAGGVRGARSIVFKGADTAVQPV
jgi:hypothetical protein